MFLQPCAVLKQKPLVPHHHRRDVQVTPLTQRRQIPPSAIALVPVQVVNRQDAPALPLALAPGALLQVLETLRQ
jgi:hypothetical protein